MNLSGRSTFSNLFGSGLSGLGGYKNKKDLDETMNDIITEIHRLADSRNCFIEADAKSADSKFFWE